MKTMLHATTVNDIVSERKIIDIMASFLTAVLLFLAGVFLLYFSFAAIPLLPHQKNKIIQHGIIQYTLLDSAKSIEKERVIKASSDKTVRRTYFFMNTLISSKALQQNNLQGRDAKILITGLTQEQITRFRVRYCDYALEHKGDFMIDDYNQIRIEPFPPEITKLSKKPSRLWMNSITRLTMLFGLLSILLSFFWRSG